MQSETPRTDEFARKLEVRVPQMDAATTLALSLVVRELMLAWAEFARSLERETRKE